MSGRRSVWLVLGALAAAVVPLDRAPTPTRGPAPALLEPSPPSAPEAEPTPSSTEPCAIEPALEQRLAILQQEHDETRAFQRQRWGEPTSPPVDWDRAADEQRYNQLLDALPERLWSTVDCTHHPCIGAFLTRDRMLPDDFRALLDLPHLTVHVGSWYYEGETTWMVGIAFLESPTDDPLQQRWATSLIQRHRHRHAFDIGTVARGGELAE